jgi:hypothetical protein
MNLDWVLIAALLAGVVTCVLAAALVPLPHRGAVDAVAGPPRMIVRRQSEHRVVISVEDQAGVERLEWALTATQAAELGELLQVVARAEPAETPVVVAATGDGRWVLAS